MADAHPDKREMANGHLRHEATDVNIRAVLAFGFGLMVAAALIHFIVWLLFAFFQSRQAATTTRQFPLAVERQNRLPAEPRLQTDPRGDMGELRAREEAILKSYGWVDKDAGVVRIPIDEAMRLVVERGLPARTTAPR